MEMIWKFLAMGGHAAYVWPALGVAVFGLAILAYFSWRQRAKSRRQLAALERNGRA
jgi:heme exporter protein CcmD